MLEALIQQSDVIHQEEVVSQPVRGSHVLVQPGHVSEPMKLPLTNVALLHK